MNQIVSFEATPHGACGDILTQSQTEHKRLKIGLLACGYFEYWRMFSPAFKKQVLGDIKVVAAGFRRHFDLVFPGVVDTLDAADQAGRVFADNALDLLVVMEGTYVPDFISLHAIDYVPQVPVVMLSSQTAEDISPDDNYEMLMRNSALIGTTQLSGSFKKMGRAYDIVVGAIGAPDIYRDILSIAQTWQVAARLRRLNIGMIGHVFRGMYDLENDKTKIKGVLGPNVIYVELAHLVKLWKQVTEKETRLEADRFAARFQTRAIKQRDLYKSVRVGLAMERLQEKLRLDALCFLGQHYIEKEMDAPARIGSCMMLDKGRHLVACEGDLAGLAMMHAMHWLTGNSPLQAEWGQYDASHNAVFIVGHGVAAPALAADEKSVTLTPSPEEWGFKGGGVNMEFIMKPGPVTMSHLLDTPQGWQMLISGGQALEYPCLPCHEIHALVQVEKPVREYLVEIQRQGVPHHVIVVHGDIRRELQRLATILGIRSFEV